MSLEDLLVQLLADPSPDLLWQMHPQLLALDTPDAESAREVARLFYGYWHAVQSKLSAKQASTFAAVLAGGSVGGVALQELLHTLRDDPRGTVRSLLATGLTGVLEMLSATQHIKAWDVEFGAVHDDIVWTLYEQYWRLSCAWQPDLAFDDRRRLVGALIEPIQDPRLSTPGRVVMVVRLCQILLLLRVAPLLSAPASRPAAPEAGA